MSRYGRYFVVRLLSGEVDVFDDFQGGGRIVTHTDDVAEARESAEAERRLERLAAR
jgi:hypothetical protein